jgi:hypothetical protein
MWSGLCLVEQSANPRDRTLTEEEWMNIPGRAAGPRVEGLVQRIRDLAADLHSRLGEYLLASGLETIQDLPQGESVDVLHDDRIVFFEVLEDLHDAPVLDLIHQGKLLPHQVHSLAV